MAQVSQNYIFIFSIIEFSFKKLACIEMKTRFVHAFESKGGKKMVFLKPKLYRAKT